MGKNQPQPMKYYPEINKVIEQVIVELSGILSGITEDRIRQADLFDEFCHWFISIKKHPLKKPQYWKIAPGEQAWEWESCRENGYIAIGWEKLGDISRMTRKEFNEKAERLSKEIDGYKKVGMEQVWNFAKDIKEGDYVIANLGTKEVLGIGVVTGPYYFVENTRHGHRLPIDWIDTQKREVKKPAWVRTLIKLDEEEFREIVETPPGTFSDGLFTEKTFELLDQLHENPTRAFYHERSGEFDKYVVEPVKELMTTVASKLPKEMKEKLETEKSIFGKIPKNDFGRGGAWDHFWGAFYPRGRKRIESAQLFVWINRDVMRYGFSIGMYGGSDAKVFTKNLRENARQIIHIFNEMNISDSLLFGDRAEIKVLSGVHNAKAVDIETWVNDIKNQPLTVCVEIPSNEVLSFAKERLVDKVTECFVKLYPLVILTIEENDPMKEIIEFISGPDEYERNPAYPLDELSAEIGFEESLLERWIRAINRKG
ncbi:MULTISPECIES: DUF2461 family protein [Kosmotoga]|nr:MULTISPECIES: DUF2461 family protein [Kosmotoga]MDI3524173.1 5-methylcytosine-specific restriction enzyme [Kosmotoga sp.]MDK2954052.1 5-methylcytosine-specific restriction enzyme [Kosmotoga sp.]